MADRRIDELTALTSLATGDELIVADASETDNNLKTKKISLSTLRSWLAAGITLAAGRITSGVLGEARIPSLNASKIDSGTFATARIPSLAASKITSGVLTVPGPVVIVSNIASYDATQNRFEDSSGGAVTVPDGSIVTLTKAVYDAAVADSGFTPNANAVFLTR